MFENMLPLEGGGWSLTIANDVQLFLMQDFIAQGNVVREITMGRFFNHPIPAGSIPQTVERLTFGKTFDQPIHTNTLPSGLETLIFGEHFNGEIIGSFPTGLKKLVFGYAFRQTDIDLPASLEELHLGGFNHPICPGYLPRGLKTLVFGNAFHQNIDDVNVKSGALSRVCSAFKGKSHNRKYRIGGGNPEVFSDRILPPSLETLEFGIWFNKPIGPGVLPGTLKKLKFGQQFNQKLSPGVFPDQLETLEFGEKFNKPIAPGVLPNSLTTLIFRGRFNQGQANGKSFPIRHDLIQQMLPPNLQVFVLDNSHERLDLYYH